MASSSTRFLNHTQRRATLGRTPLDKWSARRRDLYLTTHKTHNKHIPDLRCKIHNLTTKRVWKLPTSTQLRATWHTDSLDMVVLPSTGALRYHNCCIDGGTNPEYFGLIPGMVAPFNEVLSSTPHIGEISEKRSGPFVPLPTRRWSKLS
jgi:hypothetical protein